MPPPQSHFLGRESPQCSVPWVLGRSWVAPLITEGSFWKSCTAFAMGPGGLADLLRVRDSDTCGLQVTVWYPSVVGRVLPPHLLFEVGHLKVLVVPGATPGDIQTLPIRKSQSSSFLLLQ